MMHKPLYSSKLGHVSIINKEHFERWLSRSLGKSYDRSPGSIVNDMMWFCANIILKLTHTHTKMGHIIL